MRIMKKLITRFLTIFVLILILISPHSLYYAQEQTLWDFSYDLEFNDYLIMPETLMYKIERGDTDYILLDIRESEQFNESHIIGAENHSWNSGSFQEHSNAFPKDIDIYIISQDGRKGFEALRYLLDYGFVRVYNIEGGMDNWLYSAMLQ
jgi:rhodanese-related sulfurtransferase